MKKNLILFVVLLNIGLQLHSQNFSKVFFKSSSGDTILLRSLLGKKTLFFVLPLDKNDQHYGQLQAFKERYQDTIRIVGILSIEDGFRAANSSSIQKLYSEMGIILTEAMYTRKSSGHGQSSLFRWLTNKKQNLHYDMDATGVGHMAFLNESGRLFAVLPSQASLASPIIDKIVHSKAP